MASGWSGVFKPYHQGISQSPNGVRYIRLMGKETEKRINSFFNQFANHVAIGM